MGLWQDFKAFRQSRNKPIPFERGTGGQGGGYGAVTEALLNAGQRYAGTRINYNSEVGDLQNSTLIMSAVRWVAKNFADARLYVATKDGDNKESEIAGHPLIERFYKPNSWYSGRVLARGIAASWVMAGEAYILKRRNVYGQAIEWWYEPHTTIRPRWDMGRPDAFIDYYEVLRDGVWYEVPLQDVIVFRDGIDPVTRRGTNGMASLLREFYVDNQGSHFMAVLLRHGLVPPVAMGIGDATTPGPVGGELEVIKQETYRKMTGDRAGLPLIFGGPIKVQKLGFDYSSVGMREVRKIPKERFCSVVGISQQSLRLDDEHSTYNNVKEFLEADYGDFIKPMQETVAADLVTHALPDYGEDENQIVAWDYTNVDILKPDQNKEWERISKAFDNGELTRAEAREAKGYKFDLTNDNVYKMKAGQTLLTPEERQAAKMEPDTPENPLDEEDDEALAAKSAGYELLMEFLSDNASIPHA